MGLSQYVEELKKATEEKRAILNEEEDQENKDRHHDDYDKDHDTKNDDDEDADDEDADDEDADDEDDNKDVKEQEEEKQAEATEEIDSNTVIGIYESLIKSIELRSFFYKICNMTRPIAERRKKLYLISPEGSEIRENNPDIPHYIQSNCTLLEDYFQLQVAAELARSGMLAIQRYEAFTQAILRVRNIDNVEHRGGAVTDVTNPQLSLFPFELLLKPVEIIGQSALNLTTGNESTGV